MTKYTPEHLRLAAEWLRHYEGDAEDNDGMCAIAEFLDAKAHDKERDALITRTMRELLEMNPTMPRFEARARVIEHLKKRGLL